MSVLQVEATHNASPLPFVIQPVALQHRRYPQAHADRTVSEVLLVLPIAYFNIVSGVWRNNPGRLQAGHLHPGHGRNAGRWLPAFAGIAGFYPNRGRTAKNLTGISCDYRTYPEANSRKCRPEQPQTAYAEQYDSLTARYEALQAQHDALQQQKERRQIQADAISGCLFALQELDLLQVQFSDARWNATVERVTMYADERLVFRLRNGAEVGVEM